MSENEFRATAGRPSSKPAEQRGVHGSMASTTEAGSKQLKHYVHDLGFALCTKAKPTFLEYFQHGYVFWQDLRNQFPESSGAGNLGEPAHQCCTDSLPLVPVDHRESHLRLPGLQDDVTSVADDRGITATKAT